MGKMFLLVGCAFVCVGALLLLFKNAPFLGKLPGDILIRRENFTFYFPLATSILLSLLLSLLFYFIGKK